MDSKAILKGIAAQLEYANKLAEDELLERLMPNELLRLHGVAMHFTVAEIITALEQVYDFDNLVESIEQTPSWINLSHYCSLGIALLLAPAAQLKEAPFASRVEAFVDGINVVEGKRIRELLVSN